MDQDTAAALAGLNGRIRQTQRQVDFLERNAEGARPMRLSFPTKPDLDAFTGWSGLVGYVVSSGFEYMWRTSWGLWSCPKTVYTPALGGVSLGDGSLNFTYWVSEGRVWVDGKITLGGTSSISGEVTVDAPMSMVGGSVNDLRGSASLYDAGVLVRPGAVVQHSAATAVRVRSFNATTGNLTALSATSPFTWGSGDSISARFDFWP